MIMRFDLERTSPPIANIDDARVLPWTLHHATTACRQPLQMYARRFIRAVFAPHDTENSQLSNGRLASTQQLFDFFVFFRREAMFADHLRRDAKALRHVHREFKTIVAFRTVRWKLVQTAKEFGQCFSREQELSARRPGATLR